MRLGTDWGRGPEANDVLLYDSHKLKERSERTVLSTTARRMRRQRPSIANWLSRARHSCLTSAMEVISCKLVTHDGSHFVISSLDSGVMLTDNLDILDEPFDITHWREAEQARIFPAELGRAFIAYLERDICHMGRLG